MVRLRVRSENHTAKVEVPGASWGDVKSAIAAQLFPNDASAAAELQLSFNNKDMIQGDDGEDLKSLGIAAGDLLWVLNPKTSTPLPTASEPKRAKEAAVQPPAASTATAATDCHPDTQDIGTGSVATDDTSAEQEQGFPGPQQLPAAQAVPSYLLRTLAHNSATAATPARVLLLMAHASMLETGFEPTWVPHAGPSGEAGDAAMAGGNPYTLPPSIQASASIMRLSYWLPALQQNGAGSGSAAVRMSGTIGARADAVGPAEGGLDAPCCTLQCSTMGPDAAVLVASTPKGHLHQLPLLASSFLTAAPSPMDTEGPSTAAGSRQQTGAEPAGGTAEAGKEGTGPVVAGCWDGQQVQLAGGRYSMGSEGVRRLWRVLKDGVAFPLLLAVYSDVGLPAPAGLLALPEDLKLYVLAQLNALQLAALSGTCAELRHLASQDDLWRPLFETEFPAASSFYTSQAVRRGYKWAFGACWRDRRQKEEAARRQRRFMPSIPNLGPRPPFYPPPGPLGMPGITGGDYDRLPQPFLGGGPGMYPGGGLGGVMFGSGRRQGRGGGGFHML